MENDVEAYHYRISLRVFHPSISPQEVTRLIGIEPQRAWQAGTPRRTPAGRLSKESTKNRFGIHRLSAVAGQTEHSTQRLHTY